MDPILNLQDDDDDDTDDELLFRPSGLLKSPPPVTTTTVPSCTPDTRQSDQSVSTSAVISQEEPSSSSSLGSSLQLQAQQSSTIGPATKTIGSDGTHNGNDVNNKKTGGSTSSEEISKEAHDVFRCKTIYNEIHSTSLLKWYAKPKTKKKRSSSFPKKKKHSSTTNQYENVWPCYICPNVQEALAGYEDTMSLPDQSFDDNNKATTSIIRFIGYRVSSHDKIQKVPTKHLLPYNYYHDESLNNGDKMADTNARTTSATTQWNADLMSLYLKSLQTSQQEFKKSNDTNNATVSNYKLKVEEQLLHIIATSVFDREQQQQQQQQQQLKNDSLKDETDIDDTGKDDNDGQNLTLATTISATKKGNVKQRERPVTSVTKLRAGDAIEYCPPHVVADKSNIIRSTVMECYPRQDPAVLVAAGHWLPLDHQIRIVQQCRIVNSKKQVYKFIDTHPNEAYIRISMLTLDISQNGRMDNVVTTNADRLREIYNDAIQEISLSNASFVKCNDVASSLPRPPQNGSETTEPKPEKSNDTEKTHNIGLSGKKRKLRRSSP